MEYIVGLALVVIIAKIAMEYINQRAHDNGVAKRRKS